MRILKSHPLLKLLNGYLIDSPQPANITLCLVIQIVTGVTLAMHYTPSVLEAFNSVEHIMRDVNNASAFFFLVYLHIGRAIGTVILIVMMATAFLGYVLPYGATVITNLMRGFSVNNATLNRFFALHFLLPFVLAALALMHLIAMHDTVGSGNPLGISGNYDRLPFAPYFIFKDLVTIFIFFIVLSIFVFFMPNALGDSENYVMANPISIPNKLLGVIAMFAAILALMVMPITDLSKLRGVQFRPLSKVAFYIFVANFLVLMQIGAKHVETPFIEFGQISTVLYFAYFFVIVPVVSLIENSLVELATKK
ncbi:cytochrome b (mitochondrion) [Aspergillus oryzae 3.042]|uniref:Cytochrome b n=1 Tax=Aspergillus oryzae (strain 3.042) TaxID=1160506 RepID=I6U0T1_ASPO3|nr:cytochrome b [Aspergillus oryzae 3.042]AFM82510.1 cytochrome b [Aspergillus oryzae 3.042]|eukprot:AFM82510.1 cytochrome b (mitochondrion) [Aspergillus oryzae 3.042]